jgi:malonyl-CoA O-methyltransferase
MNIQDAYNEWSTTYDTDINLTRDLDQKITKNTFEDSCFNSILEIGCGTGKNTSFLAQIGSRVHAVDFSPGMIGKAKKKIQATNVRFSTADITKRWPCKDRAYDLIACNLVLEHIKDLSWIFSEAYRAMESKGRFFVCELHPFKQYQAEKATFCMGKGVTQIPSYVHHITDYVGAASNNGLLLLELKEWWHEKDQGSLPRLVSFLFEK